MLLTPQISLCILFSPGVMPACFGTKVEQADETIMHTVLQMAKRRGR
jgi:hypothetical protein